MGTVPLTIHTGTKGRKLKYCPENSIFIKVFNGELGNDPAERTVTFCRPNEPDPDNTGGGKKREPKRK